MIQQKGERHKAEPKANPHGRMARATYTLMATSSKIAVDQRPRSWMRWPRGGFHASAPEAVYPGHASHQLLAEPLIIHTSGIGTSCAGIGTRRGEESSAGAVALVAVVGDAFNRQVA